MKKVLLTLPTVVVLVGGGIFLQSPASALENANPAIVAYYFHGKVRCVTCQKLEQFSKEVLDTYFKGKLESGKLQFKIVNVEMKDNEHFAKDYKLYTKSLVLSLVKDGKEIKWKNLDKIWEYVGNKEKYADYVKTETKDFLKETS